MLKHFKKNGKTLANKWTCLLLKVADHLKLKSLQSILYLPIASHARI